MSERWSVFIAYPYSFAADDYRGAFAQLEDDLPGIRFVYADNEITNRQVLEKIREMIDEADLSLFDISTWNPNVALELGLAMGLEADYFILRDTRIRRRGDAVPADIGGLDRIEYRSLNDLRERVRALLQQEFGDESEPTVGRPRRAERALGRIRRALLTESTDDVSPSDIDVVRRAALVDELLAATLSVTSAPVKQKQVAVALIQQGDLAHAAIVAQAIKNRAMTEAVTRFALLQIPDAANPSFLWAFLGQVWPRLRSPQRRNLLETMAELHIQPPAGIALDPTE